MKNQILTILFVFLGISNILAQESKEYYVTATKLNVRDKPSQDGERLFQISKGNKIFVVMIENGWAEIEVEMSGVNRGFVSEKFISTNDLSIKNENNTSVFDDILSEKNQIYLYLFLIFLLINYIIALYKSHKRTISTIANWFDLFLVLVPVLGLIVVLFITKENDKDYNEQILLYYGILSGISIVGTLIFSIISNKNSFINILISFFAKLFVMLISAIIILVIFGGSGAKKDGRYKDGTKGNTHTKWKNAIAAIAGILILSLLYNQREK